MACYWTLLLALPLCKAWIASSPSVVLSPTLLSSSWNTNRWNDPSSCIFSKDTYPYAADGSFVFTTSAASSVPRMTSSAAASSCFSSTALFMAVTVDELGMMGTLRAGIKAVAVGEKGSKPIPAELVQPLLNAIETIDLEDPGAIPLAEQRLASFLGTLFVKHDISDTDKIVLKAVADRRPELFGRGLQRGGVCSSEQVLDMVTRSEPARNTHPSAAPPASKDFLELSRMLLDGKKLNRADAKKLGRRLFDENEPAPLKTLSAHVLRVRYETPEEWHGLMEAQKEAVAGNIKFNGRAFQAPGGKQVVQLAEPFDGVNRSDMFTPLIARHLQKKWGMLAVSVCGESSGPKYGPNLWSLAEGLGGDVAPFARSEMDILTWGYDKTDEVASGLPEFGFYLDQADVAPALDAWKPLRQNIIKRPFLATSEKYVDPCGASVFISSAFHPSYTDKMFDIAEKASDFKSCIIVRKGAEGTLAFRLSSDVDVVCGVRNAKGTFDRYDFTIAPEDLSLQREMDLPKRDISSADMVKAIKTFATKGTSGDVKYDARVALTLAGIDKAMLWITGHIK